jgi:hypothetical protein
MLTLLEIVTFTTGTWTASGRGSSSCSNYDMSKPQEYVVALGFFNCC